MSEEQVRDDAVVERDGGLEDERDVEELVGGEDESFLAELGIDLGTFEAEAEGEDPA